MIQRHKVFYQIFRLLAAPYFFAFNYRWKVFVPKSKTYLVLTNHNTNWDFFLFGLTMRRHMYFVASEHIYRRGFVSRLIRFLGAPIPRKKGASGDEAAALILERLRQGQNVCMMAEGNRSFSGETGWISPRNAALVRESGAGLVTLRLHGGYFQNPRWSTEVRRGPSWGEAVHEYTPADIAAMTDEELTEAIRSDLYVNAYDDQAQRRGRYRCRRPAEKLETALFLCPDCGRFSTLRSEGDRFLCEGCGMDLRFNEYGYFEPAAEKGRPAPFDTVLAWDRWQQKALRERLAQPNGGEPLFTDRGLRLSLVEPGKRTSERLSGELRLYRDRLELTNGRESIRFPVASVEKISVVLRDTLLFTAAGQYWELRPEKPISALKYLIAVRLLQGKAYR